MNESQTSQNLNMGGRYLCFHLGKESYAIPLLQVKEVIANTETTAIPQAPTHFRGIMNLRGQIVLVIDLRLKMKVGKGDVTPETTIIILDVAGHSLGLVVDNVNSVSTFENESISGPPAQDSGVKIDFIHGVAKHEKSMTLLLDLKKVLNFEDMKTLKGQASKAA